MTISIEKSFPANPAMRIRALRVARVGNDRVRQDEAGVVKVQARISIKPLARVAICSLQRKIKLAAHAISIAHIVVAQKGEFEESHNRPILVHQHAGGA